MTTPNANMYFVALVCPPEIDTEIAAFKQWMKDHYQCTVAQKSAAHITLVKPFWIELTWEDYLVGTLRSYSDPAGPFEISLHGFSHFGKRVIYVDVKHTPLLNDLKKRVEAHFIRSFGDSLKREQILFEPHVTIANRDLKPGDFNKAWEHFRNTRYERTFLADRISLLRLVDGKWIELESKELKQSPA
jgi:2'-5' RNA ligase